MDLFGAAAAEIDGPGDCYRWTLERHWNIDLRPMLVIGNNPSTADAERDDPTVKRWCHFAAAWGHGGIIAVNLWPYRASDPRMLDEWLRKPGRQRAEEVARVRDRNLEVILHWHRRCARTVACWGRLGYKRHVDRVVARLQPVGIRNMPLYCFGTNPDGSPKHVMARGKRRVPDDQQPIVWNNPPEA